MRVWTLLLLSLFCGCGSVDPGTNPDPVDVTLNVTMAGKPANDLKLNFQPTGPGALPAVVDIANGKSVAKVTPGKYTYFITAGKSPASFNAVPKAFHEGSLDRQIEVKAGDTIEIKLE